MEDSTAMTIEFLRARLLSERSVSRSARQRADDLEKKVTELEEHLRAVSLQRKMAEKATVDVLAILENHGITDVSEDFESESDLEIPCGSDVSNSNDSAKDVERSVTSKGRRHGPDELSGSDLDSSPLSGRNLSWKGRHDSPPSHEKYQSSSFRRRTSFSSISSAKHHLGKSCRKIRHGQTRSVVEDSRDNFIKVHHQDNEIVSSSTGSPNCSNGYGRDKDMEKELEHQAQLMDQYEAMEKAQRDWEEKFSENNNSAQDIDEVKGESKAQFPCSDKMTNSNSQKDKAEPADSHFFGEIFKAGDGMRKSFAGIGGYNNINTSFSCSDLFDQENFHSQQKGNHQDLCSHCNPDSKETNCIQGSLYGPVHQNEALSNKKDLYAIVSHEQSHNFCGALESLKQARVFLQQELNNKLPLGEAGYAVKAIIPSASVSKNQDRFDIPFGCSRLFRIPADFSDEATARFNVHDPTSRFQPNLYLDRGISETYDGHSDYDQSPATQYWQNGSRFNSEKHPFDPLSDKYSYPRFPIYLNATPQMPFGDELSRPLFK